MLTNASMPSGAAASRELASRARESAAPKPPFPHCSDQAPRAFELLGRNGVELSMAFRSGRARWDEGRFFRYLKAGARSEQSVMSHFPEGSS
jgi:hypothetical protein